MSSIQHKRAHFPIKLAMQSRRKRNEPFESLGAESLPKKPTLTLLLYVKSALAPYPPLANHVLLSKAQKPIHSSPLFASSQAIVIIAGKREMNKKFPHIVIPFFSLINAPNAIKPRPFHQ
jgi:hypothetical protein